MPTSSNDKRNVCPWRNTVSRNQRVRCQEERAIMSCHSSWFVIITDLTYSKYTNERKEYPQRTHRTVSKIRWSVAPIIFYLCSPINVITLYWTPETLDLNLWSRIAFNKQSRIEFNANDRRMGFSGFFGRSRIKRTERDNHLNIIHHRTKQRCVVNLDIISFDSKSLMNVTCSTFTAQRTIGDKHLLCCTSVQGILKDLFNSLFLDQTPQSFLPITFRTVEYFSGLSLVILQKDIHPFYISTPYVYYIL